MNTSVNVLMINAQGIMLSVLGRDYFLSYNRVPWLKEARISNVLNVRMAGRNEIEWPEIDGALEIESFKHPVRYPLIMKRSSLDFVESLFYKIYQQCPSCGYAGIFFLNELDE